MVEAKDLMSISEFYAEKTIFVTGATGFLGKIVVEKLLRACPLVKKIYLLTRSRRGVKPQQRIDDLLQSIVSFLFPFELVQVSLYVVIQCKCALCSGPVYILGVGWCLGYSCRCLHSKVLPNMWYIYTSFSANLHDLTTAVLQKQELKIYSS